MTDCGEAPLVPYDDTEGSFIKVYLSDTGLIFYKLGLNPRLWLESQEQGLPLGSSDFRGALAENSVMQALRSNDLQTYVCVLSRTPRVAAHFALLPTGQTLRCGGRYPRGTQQDANVALPCPICRA